MCATLSELIAAALVREAGKPTMRGRRLLFDGLYGIGPVEVFEKLRSIMSVPVSIETGEPDAESVELLAIPAEQQLLIPYLVDDDAPGNNAGSAGFAATLRTQFAEGSKDRVLLICASDAVETVSSATERVSELDSLAWVQLVQAELARVADGKNHLPTSAEREIVSEFAKHPDHSAAAFAKLNKWLETNLGASEQALGKSLWEIDCFLSDPSVHNNPGKRLPDSRRLRQRLDELFASSGKPFESEVRKLIAKGGAPSDAADKIINARGAFGLDYEAFTYDDATCSTGDSDPLTTDDVEPIVGARTTLRSGGSLIVWLGTSDQECKIRLSRALRTGEFVTFRWTDGNEVPIVIESGTQQGTIKFAADSERLWKFGTLTTSRQSGSLQMRQVAERLEVAVHRSDATWFAVEAARDVNATQEAFNAERDPIARILDSNGAVAGHCALEISEDEAEPELTTFTVEYQGGTCPLPVLPLGEDSDADDPEDMDDPTDGDGGAGSDPASLEGDSFPSIPHALVSTKQPGWPATAQVTYLPDSSEQSVTFQLKSKSLSIDAQRPAGIDGTQLEQSILDHPEWTTYNWSPDPGQLRRGQDPALADTQLDNELVDAFLQARESFFDVLRQKGSVYACDPTSSEAAAYVSSYLDLLGSAKPSSPTNEGWDALILCDAVRIGGRPDELLIAPTSPLSVAFYAELSRTFAGWVSKDDIPSPDYRKAISLRHALPLIHAGSMPYETSECPEMLWRRYTALGQEGKDVTNRNVRFIAQRLRFFLRVHPSYEDPKYVEKQTLQVTFANARDPRIVLGALADFYARERREDPAYSLPRLEVTLVDDTPLTEREIDSALEYVGRDDLVRLVQSRVVIRASSEPPDFSHLAFIFRTPGTRGARNMQMNARPSTAFLDGLAAAPARHVLEGGRVFAWGTWAPRVPNATPFRKMLTSTLELAGSQPAGKLDPEWTNMVSTTVDRTELREQYSERAVWVVHLDRLLGIEAFAGDESHLIEYEDRADPDEPGYDGITSTRFIEPYRDAIARALRSVDHPQGNLGDPSDAGLQRILQRLNAVSGRWAIEILQRGDNDILRTIGYDAAIAAIEQLERCIGSDSQGTGVLIALDEIVPGVNSAGIPRVRLPERTPDGAPMGDDLLLLWIPHTNGEDAVIIRGAVIEVKFKGSGSARLDEARGEIGRTREWLHEVFNTQTSSRPFRARDLAELIASASSRAHTFGLGQSVEGPEFNAALQQIGDGNYELDLRHWRDGRVRTGIAIALEAQSTTATSCGELPPPGNPIDHIRLGMPVMRDLVNDREITPSNSWTQLSFEPPEPHENSPVTPAPDPASAHEREDSVPDSNAEVAPTVAEESSATPPTLSEEEGQEVATIAAELDAAMARYNLAAEPFQTKLAQVGPNVIRFRTRPLGTVGVSDVERRAADLGREIGAAHAVIVSQEPYYICIDVPRRKRKSVPYIQVAGSAPTDTSPGALDFIVGLAPSGDIRTADLARLPHLLVAGATGSGKSVFLRSMLCHLVRTRGPGQLRLLIIDPKQLDFRGFRGLPHLQGGEIITEPLVAIEALKATIDRERERRLDILEAAGVSSAVEFYEQGNAVADLPQMVVLVDEFADLVGALPKNERDQFLGVVQRYVQITRAMGIYMVLATQRPSVDVITGSIKANLPARVALSLPSNRDSQTIIDQAGAEDLLGGGDLLYYLGGRVERLQGTFANASDVSQANERWKGVANPDGERYWELP